MSFRLVSSLVLMLGVSAACTTVGPDYAQPEIDSPDQWTKAREAGLVEARPNPDMLSEWWKNLGDSILDSLILRAIAANLDLRTADAQLRQARAQRAVVGSTRFPTVDATGAASHARSSENAGTGVTSELYSSSFDAGWEIDIFGGRRRAIEAAEADYQVAQEARYDVLVSVVAETALNYVELRTLQSQRAVAAKNLTYQEETLKIVRTQFEAGTVIKLDLDRAVTNTETTRSEIPRFNQGISESKNRLAVLVGMHPGSLNSELLTRQDLPKPALNIAVGVPAETLRQRPDVRRAERQLAAETARIGVATAELYPQFNLSGTIGIESFTASNFFEGDSGKFGIGPTMKWNIFDGSRIRQQIKVQNAVQEQALIQYEASILGALEEVENAITAFVQEQLRYQALSEAALAAGEAADIAQSRYEAGATDFLTVLDAQRSLLNAQNNQVSSEGMIVSNLIRLYKSLGGGWSPSSP